MRRNALVRLYSPIDPASRLNKLAARIVGIGAFCASILRVGGRDRSQRRNPERRMDCSRAADNPHSVDCDRDVRGGNGGSARARHPIAEPTPGHGRAPLPAVDLVDVDRTAPVR